MQHLTSCDTKIAYFVQEKRTCALCKEEFKASQAMKRHLMVAHHRIVCVYSFSFIHFSFLRGCAKLDKFNKTKNKLGRAHPPTHIKKKLEPITDLDRTLNHNDYQLLLTYPLVYTQNTRSILPQNFNSSVGLFRDYFIVFPNETWTHPPTSTVISF